ncbi:hypothetical protein [Streptomyces pseudovenezuelae]|uniref:hypothetical protein n=1 Tax=Streptomyces pseudovenezuelae TaxID=67350 RepID=UPI0036E7BC2D
MTAQTRTAKKTTPADTGTAPTKKTAARPARKRTTRKPTAPGAPKLSLVKPKPTLPARNRPFMTDAQAFATNDARHVGITTVNIRDWRDHRDGTATRRLRDGSTLHYHLETRTLTWQAICPMGAIHTYQLTSPSVAAAARVHADRCKQPHADLSTVPPLTANELEDLGLLQTPTWARPDRLGGEITQTITVQVPENRERALADTLAHSTGATDDTQPMSTDAIAAHIAQQLADQDTAKEHPQP